MFAENFLDFKNVAFDSNISEGHGGHVHIEGGGPGSKFDGCSFVDGRLMISEALGGAMYVEGSSDLELHDCDANQNYSGDDGGAFLFNTTGTVTIDSSRLMSNRPEHDSDGFFSGSGGQVKAARSQVIIVDSYIHGYAGVGGAIYGDFDIRRSTITGMAGAACGAASLSSSSIVVSSVLIGSTDGALGAVGGGDFKDCILICNRAENTESSDGWDISTLGFRMRNAVDCFIYAKWLDEIAVITGTDSGNQIGDEYGCRADFDRDGDVDADDADHVLALVGTTGWGLAEDLDHDGDIDAQDHLDVVAFEGTSCP